MLKVSWLRRKLHYDLILTSKNIIIKHLAYPWCVSIEDCFLKIKYKNQNKFCYSTHRFVRIDESLCWISSVGRAFAL